MGQDPSQIRTEIEDTRVRMGDTAEALGHKADVPGRAKEAHLGPCRDREVGDLGLDTGEGRRQAGRSARCRRCQGEPVGSRHRRDRGRVRRRASHPLHARGGREDWTEWPTR